MNNTTHRLALPQGSKLAEFRIERILGSGGFGITYLALDTNLNYYVALKEYLPNEIAVREKGYTVMPKSDSDNDDFDWGLKRFKREAQKLVQFKKHPNILSVSRVFKACNTAYMVTDYEHGKTLEKYLEALGRKPDETELRQILMPLLDALETVHQADIWHLDIKPDNIYICLDEKEQFDKPVLIDFGSSRKLLSLRSRSMAAIVAEGYSPAEQYERDVSGLGAWSDIYAMAAVMHRAITGKIPPGASARANAVVNGKPDPLPQLARIARKRYSAGFLAAIDKGLAMRVDERPQSVAQWRKMFDKPKPAGWKKRLAVFAVLLLLAAGIAGYGIQKDWTGGNWFTGKLTVQTEPVGADVYINGDKIGKAPVTLKNMKPGRMEVRAVLRPDFRPVQKNVTVRMFRHALVTLKLPLNPGSVRVETVPSVAEVYFGTDFKGTAPVTVEDLKPGDLEVTAKLPPGYLAASKTVRIQPGREMLLKLVLPAAPGSVHVITVPSDANVYIRNQHKGTAPVTINHLKAGDAVVKAELSGYLTVKKTVRIKPGQKIDVRLELPRALGSVYIETEPAGAAIYVSGNKQNKNAPLTVPDLPPGNIEVQAELPGYITERETVTIIAGEMTPVTLKLHAKTGKIAITSHPDNAKWFLDGKYMGNAPDQKDGLEPGKYHLTVEKLGYSDWNRDVNVIAGETKEVEAKLKPGDFTEPVTGMEFVWITNGCFQMGQTAEDKRQIIKEIGHKRYKDESWDDELPRHQVCLDGFWMGKYEVTNQQYRMFKPGHNSGYWNNYPLNMINQPAVNVSWDDVDAYVKWLRRKTGKPFRLPFEAEWEYAARAGTETVRYWGDSANLACNDTNVYDQTLKDMMVPAGLKFMDGPNSEFERHHHNCVDGHVVSAPVGSFGSSQFGLYDMLGNVWEWCADWYAKDYYSTRRGINPRGPSSGSNRVLRGGSWFYSPRRVRAAYRNGGSPGNRDDGLGFRLVLPGQ